MRRKGMFGEELPATIITVILLFIFIAASLTMYTQFFSRMGLVERERAASSAAEFMFYSAGGAVMDPDGLLSMFENRTRMMVTVTDLEDMTVRSIGSVENASAASVSSAPILLYSSSDGRMHLGRVDVYAS